MKIFENKRLTLILAFIPGYGFMIMFKNFRWNISDENLLKRSLLDYSTTFLFCILMYQIIFMGIIMGLIGNCIITLLS